MVGVILALGAASCGSAGTGRTRAAKLKANTVYIGDDGTVVVKGFGDAKGASTLCVLPPGPARTLADQSTKIAAEFKYQAVGVGADVDSATKRRLERVFELSKEMVYVQQIYANACVMFGNGLFGPTCVEVDGRCKSGAPDTTMTRYTTFIEQSLRALSVARDNDSCGDGQKQEGEMCDDGNSVDTDACVACSAAKCGDGKVQRGIEACDDGNGDDTDACTNACTVTPPPVPSKAK
jgi:cysteine-rich repeat protein